MVFVKHNSLNQTYFLILYFFQVFQGPGFSGSGSRVQGPGSGSRVQGPGPGFRSSQYRHTCSFSYFLVYVLSFLNDKVDEECEYFFKQQNFSLKVLLINCWIFCQFQPAVACKSVAYKKKCVY